MSLVDYQTLVDSQVRDVETKISSDERDQAIVLAVTRFDRDKPRTTVEDVAGQGSQQLSLPLAWENDFSEITMLEHPVGNIPPEFRNDYQIYQGPVGDPVIYLGTNITLGEMVRMTYTVRHLLDNDDDTIPLNYREAVAGYASAVLCDQLASLYAGDAEPTIAADTVDHNGKSREFSARAKLFRKTYFDAVGVTPKKNTGHSAYANFNQTNSLGHDRLLHSNRYR